MATFGSTGFCWGMATCLPGAGVTRQQLDTQPSVWYSMFLEGPAPGTCLYTGSV
jgi:hypothetical protein